jgi:hypothetical protein
MSGTVTRQSQIRRDNHKWIIETIMKQREERRGEKTPVNTIPATMAKPYKMEATSSKFNQ